MKLFKILFEHYSQKDGTTGIKCFLLAENDEQVYEWLKSDPHFGDDWITTCWDDADDDGMFKDRMIECKGQMFDDEFEPHDLYYGLTVYGWEQLENDMDSDLAFLDENDLLHKAT